MSRFGPRDFLALARNQTYWQFGCVQTAADPFFVCDCRSVAQQQMTFMSDSVRAWAQGSMNGSEVTEPERRAALSFFGQMAKVCIDVRMSVNVRGFDVVPT